MKPYRRSPKVVHLSRYAGRVACGARIFDGQASADIRETACLRCKATAAWKEARLVRLIEDVGDPNDNEAMHVKIWGP